MVEHKEENKRMNSKRRLSFQREEVPLTKDTTCGFGPFRTKFLQKYATKHYFIILHGCLGLCQLSSWAYFNGTITTMEKRFKIPSKITGIISTGGDVSGFFSSIVMSYWGGKGHRPQWIAFGLLTYVVQMLLTATPHFIYGPGEDALKLTQEYGAGENTTVFDFAEHNRRFLCKGGELCTDDMGSLVQPLILFFAQFIGGIGGGLHWTLGISYIDDNLKKSETPFFIALSFCLRMLGPTTGYAIASACLKYYVAPSLTPTIASDDPRWIGAWWMGWLIISSITLILIVPMALFPKVLPEAAAKAILNEEREEAAAAVESVASFKDLLMTMKRLFQNKIYFYNNLASVFYCLGDEPYWVYLAKYIETQYKQSASAANFVTGTVGLGSSALGIFLSGIVISKLKPTARTLAGWNVMIGLFTVCGMLSYIFIDCDQRRLLKTSYDNVNSNGGTNDCSSECDCEYIPYSPVCSESNITYISACHAGCRNQYVDINGTTKYTDCSCVEGSSGAGSATSGLCFVDCTTPLYTFLTVHAIVKLAGAAGVASNFLVGIRCIEEKDKSAAMGVSGTIVGTLAFVPAPVLYGYILDTACLVWGKTCTGKGNCWVYDSENIAYVLNITAASFIALGTMFDSIVWRHSKVLKIFD